MKNLTNLVILLAAICIISVTLNILQFEAIDNFVEKENYDPCEYQFTITDDSATIYDYGRKVGAIKLDGELDKLMIKDNL
jgi:hypothetical protein